MQASPFNCTENTVYDSAGCIIPSQTTSMTSACLTKDQFGVRLIVDKDEDRNSQSIPPSSFDMNDGETLWLDNADQQYAATGTMADYGSFGSMSDVKSGNLWSPDLMISNIDWFSLDDPDSTRPDIDLTDPKLRDDTPFEDWLLPAQTSDLCGETLSTQPESLEACSTAQAGSSFTITSAPVLNRYSSVSTSPTAEGTVAQSSVTPSSLEALVAAWPHEQQIAFAESIMQRVKAEQTCVDGRGSKRSRILRHVCTVCAKRHRYPKDARRCAEKHKGKTHHCPVCKVERSFSRQDNLARHMSDKHSDYCPDKAHNGRESREEGN